MGPTVCKISCGPIHIGTHMTKHIIPSRLLTAESVLKYLYLWVCKMLLFRYICTLICTRMYAYSALIVSVTIFKCMHKVTLIGGG